MATYLVTFVAEVEADDEEDAIWTARNNYVSREDWEPAAVELLDSED